MDIFVPKFGPEQYIKDGVPSMVNRFKGEYRAVLRTQFDTVKYDSGWHPNTVLNQGLHYLCIEPTWSNAFDGGMNLGDSDTPVDVTQTGIIGARLGGVSSKTPVSSSNDGPPNYGRVDTVKYVAGTGVGTGLIKEASIHWGSSYNDYANTGTIRFLLDTPINKGALDELTIEHRLTWYPRVTSSVTGQFEIVGSGIYDYEMGHLLCATPTSRANNIIAAGTGNGFFLGWTDFTVLPTPDLDITRDDGCDGNPVAAYTNGSIAADNWWCGSETTYGIDIGNNVPFINGMRWPIAQHQLYVGMIFTKNGGGYLVKENTHELHMNMRMYAQRILP